MVIYFLCVSVKVGWSEVGPVNVSPGAFSHSQRTKNVYALLKYEAR